MRHMQNTALEKIVVNAGIGRLSQQANFQEKILPEVTKEFALITGQKPTMRAARQSIAGFKLRAGAIIGLKATLRGRRQQQFLEKLVKVALPRLRDFRGIDLKSVDENGNLTIGIKEQHIFPEISPESSFYDFGLEVTVVPKFRNRERAIEFYRNLGIPLKKS